MDLHSTNRVAWTFDRGCDKRREIFSQYKRNRHKDQSPEERQAFSNLRKQLYRLRTRYLPEIGFKNVLSQDGYEADDIIASVCDNLPKGEEAIIVSSDEDLFQLLGPRVCMWLLKGKIVTADSFTRQWGICPAKWPDVKALAGCRGDGVIGIKGVGEKTAVKFLTGKLKPDTKAFQAIVAGTNVWNFNLDLVRLPFVGTEPCHLQEDNVSQGAWDEIMDELGMKSLRRKGPRKRILKGLWE